MFSLSSYSLLKKFLQFFLFLNFFFLNASLLCFHNKNFVGKTSCFFVYRSLFLFMFFFHLFFMSFFVWFSWSPWVFHTSLFPPFVHPLSICSLFFVSSCFLVSFTFFSLIKLPFLLCFCLYVSLCQTLCATKKSMFLGFCKNLFFCLLFSIKKTSFSLFPFLLGSFTLIYFPCLVFFCVLKNGCSFCFTLFFLLLLFNSVSLFYSPFCRDVSKNKNVVFCWNMWEKLSFVFCFCSLVLKNIFVCDKIRFIFPLFLIFLY